MPPFLAELLGTMLLIILGDGVVANVVLNKTKGQNAGWIVITAGWGFGVTVAVYAVGTFSGAHLNPAVTIGRASSASSYGPSACRWADRPVTQLIRHATWGPGSPTPSCPSPGRETPTGATRGSPSQAL